MMAYSEITLTGHCEEQQQKLATKQSTKLENKKRIATKIKDFLAMTKSQEVKQSTNMLNRKSGHGCL